MAVFSTPAAQAASLVNTSFETGAIAPWVTSGGISASAFGNGNADGTYVALIGFDTTFGFVPGALSQSFNLASAGLVDYAFRVGRSEVFCGCNDVGLTFTARIDSFVLTSALPAFEGGGPFDLHLTTSVAGSLFLSAGAHELVFEFSRQPSLFGRAPFFELDGVSVSAAADVGETPLPAALPLFAGGLGVLGMLARRRKKAAT